MTAVVIFIVTVAILGAFVALSFYHQKKSHKEKT